MTTGERGDAQAGEELLCARTARPTVRTRARRLAALVTVLTCMCMGGSAAAAVPADTLGIYAGSGNPAGVTAFETTLGRRIDRGHDYLDKSSWASLLDLSWLAEKWVNAGFVDRIVLTVPIIPDTGGTLRAGAAGDYNTYFRTLAEKLVATGHRSVILRLGPEFNGAWFPWTMNVPDGGTLFAAYWRQIVATMRSVSGADFKFDWSPNAGSAWIGGGQQLDAADAWPGNDVVDYVGMDIYDQSWSPNRADPVARWHEYVNQRNGLAWHASFAAAHNKPMTFPEWGLADRTDGHGGGDTPFFVEQMYRWIALHPVAYHLYFESRDPNAEYALFSGRFPNAARRFIELFGPNPPTTLPPPAPPPPGPPPPPAPPPAPPPPPAVAPPGATTPGGAGAGAGAGAGSGSAGATDPHRGVPVARGSGVAGSGLAAGSLGQTDPAKLSIARARIVRSQAQLDILAPITRLASGAATIMLHAGGQRSRFTTNVDSARGQLLVRKRISPAQARPGTGIVTITYAGDADTQPQEVRLRAASQKANLVLARPRLEDGRLRATGTISARARGQVRTQIMYRVGGVNLMREYSAPIRHGRWRLDIALAPPVAKEIAARQGTVQANTLFTGYLPARMRGEMRSFQVLGE